MAIDQALELSGEQLTAVYHLTGTAAETEAAATGICVEQTVEFPYDLLPHGSIRDQIVGEVESLEQISDERFEARVRFAAEVAGNDLCQLTNLLFGNISIKPAIRLVRFELPESLRAHFKGPRFGRGGLRDLLGVPARPLLCTALKPMGLSASALADYAEKFTRGGIDIIKDDHGIADQQFCRFEERVTRCVEAVAKASSEHGSRTLYMPNITAPAEQVIDRARFAKQAGAGGLLASPGLLGLDVMRRIADDDRISLPIMAHPALHGSYVVSREQGISHAALFGQIYRLAGADAVIFPSFGGRFSFSREECRDLVEGTRAAMGSIRSIFPTPAGGMSLERVPGMLDFYGTDAIFLIGGDLHRGGDVTERCRRFRRLVE